jgi:hypothetical protein
MGKSRSAKQPSNAGARRTKTKALAAAKDAVKREARIPQPEATLVGAVFNSQVAMARLIVQFSPWAMITRQQAAILDTFTGALDGAFENPDGGDGPVT